ncbi:hypothetical protein DL89DRAFT_266288 [Linderina pennispora]|uniref:Uncharacterized protein n=1 Tax=Linderina pennispora TaxID=61395 RepID=A0A1Y1WCV2_9FUNG|nr:uncharacterized protein DL89DRAFT_266288 [Linderina pennispora]ORX71272.1 hypothetical protein DL89DRAFT_266288 [Linderina pennispora]
MVPKTKRGLVKLLGALSFLVLLPVNRFGHFCTLDYGQSSIRFVHAPSTDDQTKSKAAWDGGVRLQRVSNCLSQGNDLTLVVIDWQPAPEKPGGRPVDEPPTEDCLKIPGLADCGVIVPEFMGYTQRYVVFKNLFEPMYRVVDKINRWRAIVCKATKVEPSAHLNSPLPSTRTLTPSAARSHLSLLNQEIH